MQNYNLGTIEASEALIKDLYIDLRKKVNIWSAITMQTPQARMGYIGQHLVSVVTGFPGGKSGARGYDLIMGENKYGEIKTCYRVDQLGSCNRCHNAVSSLETRCAICGSDDIARKNDSKWLISIRNDDEFAKTLKPEKYFFVLFEFADTEHNDIDAKIWEVDPKTKGFAYCMIDYYLNIRSHSPSKAAFNMWPHSLKFAITKPKLIYHSVIHNDDRIDTIIFPTNGNTQREPLEQLTNYSQARTITRSTINNILSRLSGSRINMSKRRGLERLQNLIDDNTLTNDDLCDLFAEEVYLSLILPVKHLIPDVIKSLYPVLS